MADVEIKYNNATIASLSDSGTEVLGTNGKLCEDDITITYGGRNPVVKKDVNFIDYDGTLLYSYTASEFADLSALPANPSHSGLIALGWNWSLADAKTYVASYGKLWIGQMYITESGDTEIDIELRAPRLSPYLGIAVNGTVEVDWGDGSTKSTVTGTSLTTQVRTPHAYATDGSYTIKIHVVSGSFKPYGTYSYSILSGNFSTSENNRVYSSNVKRVRIGNSIAGIGDYAFGSCYSLSSITMSIGVASLGYAAFQSCYSLASITIPSRISSIDSNMFRACYSLASIAIPRSVNFIGMEAFEYCTSLVSITSMVTIICMQAFRYCYSLASITIALTSIDTYIFAHCYSLASITIPSGITKIGDYMFQSCFALTSITIPSGITRIGSNAFYNCYGLGLIRFEPTTPPTVSDSNAWTGIPTDCAIFVPVDSYHSYKTGTNYPSSSTYTYIGFKTYANNAALPSSIAFYPNGGTVSYTATWYATKEDAINQTNAITIGNGKEIYARLVASAAVAP